MNINWIKSLLGIRSKDAAQDAQPKTTVAAFEFGESRIKAPRGYEWEHGACSGEFGYTVFGRTGARGENYICLIHKADGTVLERFTGETLRQSVDTCWERIGDFYQTAR